MSMRRKGQKSNGDAPPVDDCDLGLDGLPDDPADDGEPVETPKTEEQKAGDLLASLALPLTDPKWGTGDWLNDKPEPRPILLRAGDDPFLPMGKVALLAAAGGAGKTQILTQLALAVASAGDTPASALTCGTVTAEEAAEIRERLAWLNAYQVERGGNVLLALGEEDREEVKRRLQKAARGLGMTPEQIRRLMARLVTLPLYGEDARLVTSDLKQAPFMAAMEELLATRDWALIILDPGSRFMGPDDEKDNAAATRFVEMVECLTKAPGNPAVIVACHTGKQGTRTGNMAEDDQYLTRGASALVDGARWAASLRWNDKAPKDYRPRFLRFLHTKTNYTPKAPPLDLVMGDDGFIRAATRDELDAMKAAKGQEAEQDAEFNGIIKGKERAAAAAAKEAQLKRLREEQDADC